MAESAFKLSNEVAMTESNTDMPALQEMINDIRESTGSPAQNSNSSLLADDLLIKQAIALTSLPESNVFTQETSSTEDINRSTEEKSENLVQALNSTGKRLSIALNGAASSITTTSEEHFIDTTTIEQTSVQQIDNTPPLVQTITTTDVPQKKPHIMISYNRSCEDACRKLRNNLRGLKYKTWMDVYDMHDNFIDGMAKAIRNSYIVLICLNRQYDNSYWCKKEIEDVAIQRIKFIPCFMEEPFTPADWLDFLVGGNIWIDFSNVNEFDNSFEKLINEITSIEKKLATNPRETPPTTPTINPLTTITLNPTIEQSFDNITRNFKTWVEENRHDLQRFNRQQSTQLISQLIQGLQSDNSSFDDQNKNELLQQLLSSTSQDQNPFLPPLLHNLTTSNYPFIKGLLFIMALWAVRVVFKRT